MNVLLAVTLVLLSAPFGYTNIIKHCFTEEEFNKHWADDPLPKIASLNAVRANVADMKEIANMHELVRFPPSYYNKFLIQKYDISLEKEARKMKSCDDIKHGVNYRVAGYGKKESRAIWQEFMKSRNGSEFYFEEEKHPLQTSVIQCVLTATCHLDADRSGNSFHTEMATITLYGWRGTFSLSDYQHGESGSKCTHGKTERGLCITPSSENNGRSEGVNSFFVYLFIAFMYLFLGT
ncbi:hypothetical protein CRE_16346 [Caenorhabditis remanei]|uniref:SCP domain-containing protein n=1 Tax=Caenorhabditis remanei TaxID=31234 RepID=E3NC76_CAERE|nr:hypothetical protein CRE_16346 [Caenorhabditis remanei]